ncbi:predicted protein [Arabidopsis lyrata subsp. lyrata]|uniref:Predicted protein n=1 Tax=Arabidopsis lyrata subsp. lyrata TaxID=81972 RepID=D7LBI8_ARALL|nr:predicted protein [Arabidopsis lyrata subsp. lyrata]
MHHEECELGTSLEVILSDSKGTKVQASFRGCAYHRYASKISPGDWFDFKDFKVVEQYGSCRATNHRYKIIVPYSTEIDIASVMRDDCFFDFVDFKKITLIKTCLKPPGDIVKTVSTGPLDGYNSDDVEELTGDGDSDEESCTEDEGCVEDDPEYQIDNDEEDTDTDEVNDRIASTDDDASEVSEDDDCAAESDDDFYEVEEDDYEDGVEDDEEDVDSKYSAVSESEEENLDGCDGKTIEERKTDKLDDYSVHHKISFDLRDSSNNVLKCELVGYEAVNFYKSFKKWQYDVIICVIRWGVVDVFQDKRTITATECTQIRLNPGIPEVAEFRTSISRKRTRTSVPKKK